MVGLSRTTSARPGERVAMRDVSANSPMLFALTLASARYWPLLSRHVRAQMRLWETRAQSIEDPDLRAMALAKLRDERFNAEAAAMLATLAPRPHRRDCVVAIVALELMFDLLDGLGERPLEDPLSDGARLYTPFLAALGEESLPAGRYENELAQASRQALQGLPSWRAVAPVALRCAQRGAEAQVRMHAVPKLGVTQARQWAERQTQTSGLAWRDYLAGAASSVLGLYALIAAAADPRTTAADAELIDAAYVPIGVVVTLLDGLVDYDRDTSQGELSYSGLYGDPRLAADACAHAARRAVSATATIRNGPHHLMTLAAAIAYWASAPEATNPVARQALTALNEELGSLTAAPTLFMRAWRATRTKAPSC